MSAWDGMIACMRTYANTRDALLNYGVAEQVAEDAARNLANREVVFLAVSGKMGSGKDTLAPRILDALGYVERDLHFFAAALKEEVNQVIALFLDTRNQSTADVERLLAEKQDIPASDAEYIVRALRSDVLDGAVTTAYDRTPSVRKALQYWGTEVRRSQDPQYWVKKAVSRAAEGLAAGRSVYATDVRFKNEADAVLACGGLLPRLNITRETQDARIKERDGIVLTEEARTHLSETDLDDYEGFTTVLATDTLTVEETVNALAASLRETMERN